MAERDCFRFDRWLDFALHGPVPPCRRRARVLHPLTALVLALLIGSALGALALVGRHLQVPERLATWARIAAPQCPLLATPPAEVVTGR